MEKIRFTQKSVLSLPCPTSNKATYYDNSTKYLAVRVTAAGAKSYYYIRRIDGKTNFLKIGDVNAIPLREAQEIAMQKTLAYAKGDPITKEKLQCPTAQTAFDEWINAKRVRGDRERNNKDIEARLNRYFPDAIKSSRIDDITRADLQKIYQDVMQNVGETTARRLIVEFRAAVNYMMYLEHPIKRNPANGFQLKPQAERDRFLQPDEVSRFFTALMGSDSRDFIDFVCIALFTSKRSGNVKAMRWEHIDIERQTWSIPRTQTKNKQPDVTVLDPIVISILERRRAAQIDAGVSSEFVFHSPTSSTGHYQEPKTAWKKLLNRAGIDDLRIHDLRRTLASWLAERNVSLHMIAGILGQKSISATPIYARIGLSPKREAVSGAVADLMAAGGVKLAGLQIVEDEEAREKKELLAALDSDKEFFADVLDLFRRREAGVLRRVDAR